VPDDRRLADERQKFPDDGPAPVREAGVYSRPMSIGNDNQIDWTAASTPEGDRMAESLKRLQKPKPPHTRRTVMDTLLGENNLSASDAGGSDPYNATGKQFRR
jgi:hypothetical protein